MIVGRLEELHALAPRLDADDAAATLAVVSEIRLALVLRDDYGWSFERIEAWIADMSRRLLLA